MAATAKEITQYLEELEHGDPSAVGRLLPFVYDDLRALADAMFRDQRDNHTLQPTALVHETYLRLLGSTHKSYEGRRHFYNVAAMAMRQLLTDYARSRGARKRGGDRKRVVLEERAQEAQLDGLDLIALDEALEELARLDPRMARVVELRFLAGLTNKEVADILGMAERTVSLDWQMARTWLRRHLSDKPEEA